VSASADSTACLYNTMTSKCLSRFEGHEGEISKVSFNPQGTKV
jgi:dynein assembly factor with WDR repeat domains 1